MNLDDIIERYREKKDQPTTPVPADINEVRAKGTRLTSIKPSPNDCFHVVGEVCQGIEPTNKGSYGLVQVGETVYGTPRMKPVMDAIGDMLKQGEPGMFNTELASQLQRASANVGPEAVELAKDKVWLKSFTPKTELLKEGDASGIDWAKCVGPTKTYKSKATPETIIEGRWEQPFTVTVHWPDGSQRIYAASELTLGPGGESLSIKFEEQVSPIPIQPEELPGERTHLEQLLEEMCENLGVPKRIFCGDPQPETVEVTITPEPGMDEEEVKPDITL